MKIIRSFLTGVVIFCFFPLVALCDEPAKRALFVSVIQNPPVFSSRKAIKKLIDFAKEARISTLFVQIYRENKAWFPSKHTDDAQYQRYAKRLGEDPFALLIREAGRQGIKVHAWLNLLSLAKNEDAWILKKYGTQVLTRNLFKKSGLKSFMIDSQFFLEPGDPRVRDELSKIVQEVLLCYPGLDGIMFDYIRYPDRDPHYGYTQVNMDRFKEASGQEEIDEESQSWKDWKRRQVTELLTGLVERVRSVRPDIQVSATGCMPYSRAYFEAYQDWPSWLNQGRVDFVAIMSYSPQPDELGRWLKALEDVVSDFSKVTIGIGAYKLVHSPDVFKKEFRACEESGSGCAVFHYGSIVEYQRLKKVLLDNVKN